MAKGKSDKGMKTKHFTDPHKTGVPLKPGTGSKAVAIKGHLVDAADTVNVTKPEAKNAGSHDHLVRAAGNEESKPWAKE